MTGAERAARYIAKLKAAAKANAGVSNAALQEELATLKAELASVKEQRRVTNAEPNIDAATFSMTQQQKLEAWKRREQRQMAAAFEQLVLEEVRRRMDEIVLPAWKKRIDDANKLWNRRKALMDKATFNAIRRALHPDSRNSASDEVLARAFDKFMALEPFLLNEKDSPQKFGDDLPRTAAEWDARRTEWKARRAKRAPARRT